MAVHQVWEQLRQHGQYYKFALKSRILNVAFFLQFFKLCIKILQLFYKEEKKLFFFKVDITYRVKFWIIIHDISAGVRYHIVADSVLSSKIEALITQTSN